MADIETIELNLLEEPKVINADATISSLSSVYGPGADLLMNDKK